MDEITASVKKLLDKYQIDTPPVDVLAILKSEGIETFYEELDDDWSGFCVRNIQGSKIVINKKHHSNRQRFTAAHELGHLKLHCGHDNEEHVFVDKTVAYNRNKASSSGEIKKEIQANQFAAELLMPKDFIINELDDADSLGYEDIANLAKKYSVSERAMSIRIENLTGITFF